MDEGVYNKLSETERNAYDKIMDTYTFSDPVVLVKDTVDGHAILVYDKGSNADAFYLSPSFDLKHGYSVMAPGVGGSGRSNSGSYLYVYGGKGLIADTLMDTDAPVYENPFYITGHYDNPSAAENMASYYNILTESGEDVDDMLVYLYSGGGQFIKETCDFVSDKDINVTTVLAEPGNLSKLRYNNGLEDIAEVMKDKMKVYYLDSSIHYINNSGGDGASTKALVTDLLGIDKDSNQFKYVPVGHEVLFKVIVNPDIQNGLYDPNYIDNLSLQYDNGKFVLVDDEGNIAAELNKRNNYEKIKDINLVPPVSVEFDTITDGLNNIIKGIHRNYASNEGVSYIPDAGTSGFPESITELNNLFQSDSSILMNALADEVTTIGKIITSYSQLDEKLRQNLIEDFINDSTRADNIINSFKKYIESNRSQLPLILKEPGSEVYGRTELNDITRMFNGKGLCGDLKSTLDYEYKNSDELLKAIEDLITSNGYTGDAANAVNAHLGGYEVFFKQRKEAALGLEKAYSEALGLIYNFMVPDESFDDSQLPKLQANLAKYNSIKNSYERLVASMPDYLYLYDEDGEIEAEIPNGKKSVYLAAISGLDASIQKVTEEINRIEEYHRVIEQANGIINNAYDDVLLSYENALLGIDRVYYNNNYTSAVGSTGKTIINGLPQ